MAEESVKVAVRVRPFNQREKDAKSNLIVNMVGNQTIVTKPKSTEEPKKFAYDFSYWSHDSFKTEANGYFSPDDPKYADQQKVFNDLGAGILSNSWEGYNASLFAYGQTGSGKSYSVVGYGVNRGIVPMICEEIFKKVDADKSSGIQYEVTFSMLEIYSEVVRDLLVSSSKGGDKKNGLLIREEPNKGFYPQGLRKQLVSNYVDITKLTDEGNANRTIAATNMNATSSRAHTIVTISLVQKYKNSAGKEMSKTSTINLVDLAGSERADATGATGDRLKEGAAINLSLTALGNVISALADQSAGKTTRVPYRDSVLTKLLMNALGGNSKTIMIAAISPADINYDESISTLRYADRAKQIKCKAIVNEDPTEKLIKSLQEENASLKKLLESGGKINTVAGNDVQLKKALEENERQMESMKKSYEERLAEANAHNNDLGSSKILEKAKTTPHLSNVNMDPSLSGTIKFLLEGDGKKTIGLKGKSDIPLNGLGILDPHATITVAGKKFTLEKRGEAKVLYNGRPITTAIDLHHLDRLVFGASQYYIFNDPTQATAKDVIPEFEKMQDEIAKASGLLPTNTQNMSREELQCQGELIDLIPAIDEANQISILLDKKVKFDVLAVSGDARGEFGSTIKPFVLMKNFVTGLQWMWEKAKFLERKILMSEFYADLKDDGVINRDKFKAFDPFDESPDTPTQIGAAAVFTKTFAYMVANKGDYKIMDFFGKVAGTINIEILPCNSLGKPLTEKDGVVIRNPETELLNKNANFILKINYIKGLHERYEDIYCQYSIFNDPAVIKTDVVRGTNNPEFKYSKNFTYLITPELLDIILNKCLYIKVWGEQRHPKPNAINSKMTTKEYFDKEKELNGNSNVISSLADKTLDPEKQKLREEINVATIKEKRLNDTIANIKTLIEVGDKTNQSQIPSSVITNVINAPSNDAAKKVIDNFSKGGSSENLPAPKKTVKKADDNDGFEMPGVFQKIIDEVTDTNAVIDRVTSPAKNKANSSAACTII